MTSVSFLCGVFIYTAIGQPGASIVSAQQLQASIASPNICGPVAIATREYFKVKNQLSPKSNFHGFFAILMLFQDHFTKGVFCEKKNVLVRLLTL